MARTDNSGGILAGMEREVRYCTTEDGVRIAYCVEGEGPPLVATPFLIESFDLEHHSPGHENFMRRLAQHFRLVRYDSRCTGSSQRNVTGVALEDRMADLAAVVRAARLKRFSLRRGFWAGGDGSRAARG